MNAKIDKKEFLNSIGYYDICNNMEIKKRIDDIIYIDIAMIDVIRLISDGLKIKIHSVDYDTLCVKDIVGRYCQFCKKKIQKLTNAALMVKKYFEKIDPFIGRYMALTGIKVTCSFMISDLKKIKDSVIKNDLLKKIKDYGIDI